ncbi:hypothetical protein HYV84_06865 [Candidatus Woesearchaeota archaeon]|nr:hypothetical protein [Candidatus Woesearchaeota archaeon]
MAAKKSIVDSGKFRHPFELAFIRGDYLRHIAESNGTTALAGQGVMALEERAVLDAYGRLHGGDAMYLHIPESVGTILGRIDPAIDGFDLSSLLMRPRAEKVMVRHTVGHTDPLYRGEIQGESKNPMNYSLEEFIEKFGFSHFKIKITGNIPESLKRLSQVAALLGQKLGGSYKVTLDGNETFESMEQVQEFVEQMAKHPGLKDFKGKVLYLEQPFHRAKLREFTHQDRKAVDIIQEKYKIRLLIDESGDQWNSYAIAIREGIRGTSLKLCKGVLHGLADMAMARLLNGPNGSQHFVSAEDLTVAEPGNFLHSLDLLSALGFSDAELNGYCKTMPLGHRPRNEAVHALANFPNLYRRDGDSVLLVPSGAYFPTKDIQRPGFGGGSFFDPNASTDKRRELS